MIGYIFVALASVSGCIPRHSAFKRTMFTVGLF